MTGSFTFIGNATALVRWGPLTVLTDPNFLHAGEHAYLGHGLTSKRLKDPALQVHDLPPLDAVLLSHHHGDHWDRVARDNLDKSLPVVTTRHAARRLFAEGFRGALGLDTWQSHELARDAHSIRVTALPARHAPAGLGFLLPPVMGSLLELSENGRVARRVYITGDTLTYDAIGEIARRFPHIDTTVLHLGGTTIPGGLPFGLMVTMDGEQGAELLSTVGSPRAIPIHVDDYTVFRSPLSEFLEAASRRGLRDRVEVVRRGKTVAL